MNQITAPYGFVPLGKKVVLPDWLELRGKQMPPVHDVPFEDGLCGTLELEIEAESPIFTRGSHDKEMPFQLEDGTYALPGTALRGALRNVVEIASFSRFSRVNDHRYAVRDLQNRALYGQYMAEIVENLKTGKKEPMPLVNAGWLTGTRNLDGDWSACEIEVCDFAKFEYRNLERLAGERGVRNFRPGEKQSSVDKYRKWGQASLDVNVQLDWRRPDKAGPRPLVSGYGVAFIKEDGQQGRIVFTGQPSFWKPDQMGRRPGSGSAKHHDFVFVPQARKRTLRVDDKVFRDFEFGHSDRGQQNALGRSQEPNPEWKHWEKQLDNRQRIPVFFLTDDSGQVSALGLAMMFRLPYQHSIGEAVAHVSPEHRVSEAKGSENRKVFDFAEGLFGTVQGRGGDRDDRTALALKGRIGISHARATAGTKPQGAVEAILGAPKASYYPNYVEQDPGRPGGQPRKNAAYRADYKTWNDIDGAPRGWKRYRVLTQTWNPKPPTGSDGRSLDLSKVGTRFHPLPAGTKFRAHVDVHNLRPEELGALLWILDFGKDAAARHMIGMARPLGYGRVKLSVTQSEVHDMEGSPADFEVCRSRFVEYMRGQVPNWEKSPQIEELRALARPVPPTAAFYQRLDPGARINEFVDAKKEGLALPSAFNHPGGQASAPPQGGGFRSQQGGNGHGAQQQGYRGGAQGGTGLRGGPGGGYQGRREGPSRPEPPPIPAPKYDGPPQRAQPTPTQGGEPWRGKKKDDIIEIELLEVNRKGKWRCKVVGYAGTQGTVTGTPSADAAPGKRYKVSVVVGNDPGNLELKWSTE